MTAMELKRLSEELERDDLDPRRSRAQDWSKQHRPDYAKKQKFGRRGIAFRSNFRRVK